jgi:hypothetical protein
VLMSTSMAPPIGDTLALGGDVALVSVADTL